MGRKNKNKANRKKMRRLEEQRIKELVESKTWDIIDLEKETILCQSNSLYSYIVSLYDRSRVTNS